MPDAPTLPAPEPIDDPETGKQHWESLQSHYQRLEGVPTRLPAIDVQNVAREVLSVELGFRSDLPDLLAGLAGDRRAAAEEAFGLLRSEAHALFYAATMFKSTSASAKRLDKLLPQAEFLQQLGFRWLRLLRDAGIVDDQEAAAILAGRGHEDMAGDLQAMGPLFAPHTIILKALHDAQVRDEEELTKERIDRMAPVGTDLLDLLAGTPDEGEEATDWRLQVIKAFEVLNQSYRVAREEARCFLRLAQRPEADAAFPRLLGMRRPPKPKKADSADE